MPLTPEHLLRFKADLLALPTSDLYRRYVAAEECVGLTDVDTLALRDRIADQFGIGREGVVIVGSAKLGFTVTHKPARGGGPARPMFSPFSENSDVDVAIVSDALFDDIWKRCFRFWQESGYGDGYWRSGSNFRDYLFRGWMRPDKLPSEGGFTYRSEWFDFFRTLTGDRAAGDYKVTAGLYREEYFLEAYQHVALQRCASLTRARP